MKLPIATVQSFSAAGVNGRRAVDWPPSANLLKPSDSTGEALLVISDAASPREPSKQSTASSNWLNAALAASAASPIYAPSPTGSPLNSRSVFPPYYPLENSEEA